VPPSPEERVSEDILLPRSMAILPALTFTALAETEERVAEDISPPLSRESFPVVATSMLPALPVVLLDIARLKIPVSLLLVLVFLSTLMLPARTLTVPALPEEKVSVDSTPPSLMSSFPAVETSTLPALPVLPLSALLKIPV
jgi:hypothetical protein